MGRLIVFYLAALAWLAGFGTAAVASPTPAAVACGALGMLGFLGAAAARIDAKLPTAARRPSSVRARE